MGHFAPASSSSLDENMLGIRAIAGSPTTMGQINNTNITGVASIRGLGAEATAHDCNGLILLGRYLADRRLFAATSVPEVR